MPTLQVGDSAIHPAHSWPSQAHAKATEREKCHGLNHRLRCHPSLGPVGRQIALSRGSQTQPHRAKDSSEPEACRWCVRLETRRKATHAVRLKGAVLDVQLQA